MTSRAPAITATLAVLCALAGLAASPARAATVSGQLQVAVEAGSITEAQRSETLAAYRSLGRMPGNDWKVMRATVRRLAYADRLAALAPVVHVSTTVAARHGDAANGTRVRARGSAVVVQRVAGAGWWFHPLASAGQLNGLARDAKTTAATLAGAARGLLALGVTGRRGLCFEYLFSWYGAAPGWISSMSQATLASALARVSERTGDPAWAAKALDAGEPLHWAPPEGTSVTGAGGVDPLLYPQKRRYLVANAEIWSLIGMDELARVSGDARTARLADRIATRLLRIMPGWADPERPGWTLYAQGSQAAGEGAASTSYHRLTVQGLRRLCRSRKGPWCTWATRFGRDVPASISATPGRGPALSAGQ